MRWRFWRRRPKLKPRRSEQCATCFEEIKLGQEHELRAFIVDHEEVDFRKQGGGTYVSETYCKKHCPGGCERGCASI